MKRTFSDELLGEVYSKLEKTDSKNTGDKPFERSPVHVVYGGAHLFTAETPVKLGKIALKSVETYAPNFAEFGKAMWLKGADALPSFEDSVRDLERQLETDEEKIKNENFAAWFSWTIYNRMLEKLKTEPIEDFRIDFEDGYGFRADEEEDRHAISASNELAELMCRRRNNLDAFVYSMPFCGFRIKSFAPETRSRAVRTLDLFLTNFTKKCEGNFPENFVVTLPKITSEEEVEALKKLLAEFEKSNSLKKNAIKIEIMIETPQAIVNEKGEINLKKLVKAGKNRVVSAHFGAFDYTASLGISGVHQHIRHEACKFARQTMQISLSPLGVRLSDSVTTEMPIPLYKNENLTEFQKIENKAAVQSAWRKHFNNITNSLIAGFYQSWDLHPAQLVARYAAVYAFFLESKDEQAKRLKNFIEKATQAATTGNVFDDAASAQGYLNFFLRARNCGAVAESEILKITGLSENELNSASFQKIMENRRGV